MDRRSASRATASQGRPSPAWWLAGLVGLAVVVHLPALFQPVPDTAGGGYPDLALAVAEGRGLTFSALGGPVPPYQSTILYPPVYPWAAGTLIDALDSQPGVLAVRLAQLAALAAAAVVWFALARLLGCRVRSAAALAALATLDPGTWEWAAWLEPTCAFQLLLALLLLAAALWRRHGRPRFFVAMLAAGLLLPLLRSGLLEYVLLLSLVAAVQSWRQRPGGAHSWASLVFPVAVLAVVAAWGSWNIGRVGTFKLTSSSGLASVCTGPPLGAGLGDEQGAFPAWQRGSPSQTAWLERHPDPACRCGPPCDEADWDDQLRQAWVQALFADPGGMIGRASRGVAQTVLPVTVNTPAELALGWVVAAILVAAAGIAWRRDPATAGVALLVLHVLALGLLFPPTAERAAIVRPVLVLPLWLLVFSRQRGGRDGR